MTLVDGADFAGTIVSADLCIVGAGPAGAAVASVLARSGARVIVLESGGAYLDRLERRNLFPALRDHARGAQSATRGRVRGHPYYPLRLSRARGVGGSTAALRAHGLRSRPLDPIDLAGKGLLEWPIDYQEIADHLVEASRLCAIPDASRSWDSEGGFGVLGEMAAIRAVELRHGHRHAIRATAERLAESDQMWVLDATVTRLHVDDSSCVTGIDVVTSTGGRFRVEADATVLATGGIDNARILLDNPTVLGAMGAASSNVGRYFMEHLHFPAGYLLPKDANASRKIWDAFCDSGEERWITVSDEVVRSEGIARSAFVPIPVHPTSTSSGVQALGRIVRSVPYGPFAAQWWGSDIAEAWHDRSSVARAIAGRLRDRSEGASFVLGAMSEQRPNPESRVLLSDRTDRYGLRLADVAWRIDEADVQSALRSAEIVGSAFAEAGIARYLPGWTRRTMPAFEGGWHHLGTTRMSASAASGVVDSNARVHGLTNLYVAGSSVLPTGGFANPTLTLAALSLRLGYHLASRWRLST